MKKVILILICLLSVGCAAVDGTVGRMGSLESKYGVDIVLNDRIPE